VTSRTGKPVIIAEYDSEWRQRFGRERELILRTCGEEPFVCIEHVGSTAVPGLAAKPIIDIMPGLRTLDEVPSQIGPLASIGHQFVPPLIDALTSIGYQYVPEFERPNDFDEGMPERRYFRKDIDGERAFHMHMVAVTSEFWRDHLLFRNFLRVSPEDAREYERVKRRLAAEYNAAMTPQSNINLGYTDRKSDCINAIMAKARAAVAEGWWDSESGPIVGYPQMDTEGTD
jgi:GrpB-like predicted nucleotidyltransferase (UPF0157 family)